MCMELDYTCGAFIGDELKRKKFKVIYVVFTATDEVRWNLSNLFFQFVSLIYCSIQLYFSLEPTQNTLQFEGYLCTSWQFHSSKLDVRPHFFKYKYNTSEGYLVAELPHSKCK